MMDIFAKEETPVRNRAQLNGIVLTRYGLLDDQNGGERFHLPSEQDINEIYQKACQSGRLTIQSVQEATQKHYSGRLKRVE